MYRHETLTRMSEAKAIAIVSEESLEDALFVVSALLDAQMPVLEVDRDTPSPFSLIEKISSSSALVGMGIVQSPGEVVDAASAGATFVVVPAFDEAIIKAAHRRGTAVLMECATPAEIIRALEAGADAIKVFPAAPMGPNYLKAVHRPLPWAPLIPVGCVDVESVATWIDAGAIAVEFGENLTQGSRNDIIHTVHRLLKNLL